MKNHYKAWTQRDRNALQRYLGKASLKTIAKRLHRTPNSIQTRASRLGLHTNYYRRQQGTGTITPTGYIITQIRSKSQAEHRWVMEQKIGRKLHQNEDVHHRNGARNDNRPSNLEIKLKTKHGRGISLMDAIHWIRSLGYSVKKS